MTMNLEELQHQINFSSATARTSMHRVDNIVVEHCVMDTCSTLTFHVFTEYGRFEFVCFDNADRKPFKLHAAGNAIEFATQQIHYPIKES